MKPSTIIAIFQRGRSGLQRTHVFHEVEQAISSKQRELDAYLEADEVGLFCFDDSPDIAWLVTNKRIIISDGRTIRPYSFASFENVEAEGFLDGSISKKLIRNLILTGKGCKITVPLEPKAWPVLLQIFKHLIRINRGV
jgi:hypothetical protein